MLVFVIYEEVWYCYLFFCKIGDVRDNRIVYILLVLLNFLLERNKISLRNSRPPLRILCSLCIVVLHYSYIGKRLTSSIKRSEIFHDRVRVSWNMKINNIPEKYMSKVDSVWPCRDKYFSIIHFFYIKNTLWGVHNVS